MRFLWSRPARHISAARSYARPRVEELESRFAPAGIRLDIVALHEFGHSLGLAHSDNVGSIMDPFYNPNYNLNNFLTDPMVLQFKQLFSADKITSGSTSWKDALDGAQDGVVKITYSFIKDGARMDSGAKSNLFTTMNSKFGSPTVWKKIFTDQLDLWASAANGKVQFVPFNAGTGDEAQAFGFNISGAIQHDSRFGDIRIGTHRFDGAGKVLAHAYYPPTNGLTAAGDAHFDYAEQWTMESSPLAAPSSTASTSSGKTKTGAITVDHDHEHGDDMVGDFDEEMVQPGNTPPENLAATIAEAVRAMNFSHGAGYILNQVPANGNLPAISQVPANYPLLGPGTTGFLSGPRMIPGWAGSDLVQTPNDISPQENEGPRNFIPVPVPTPITPPVAEENQSQDVVKPMLLPDAVAAPIEKTSPASSTSAAKPGDEAGTPFRLPAAAVAALALGCYWWNPYTSMIEERRKRLQSIRW